LVLSCTVSELEHVLCATYPTPIQPQFCGCGPLHQIADVGRQPAHMDPKLFGREIIFEEFQRI